MATHQFRFEVIYGGDATQDGTMRASAFGRSVASLDDLYVGIAMSMGASRPEGLRIVAQLRTGSVIAQILASDEFRATIGSVIKGAYVLEALKAALEVIKLGLSLQISIDDFKKARVARKTVELERDGAEQDLARKRIGADINQLRLDDFQELRLAKALIYLNSIDGHIALRGFLAPLIAREAGAISISGPDEDEVRITPQEIAYIDDRENRVALSLDASLATSGGPDIIQSAEMILDITVITPRLNGRGSSWRFSDGSKEFAARVTDQTFLQEVSEGRISFTAGFKMRVRLRSESDNLGRVKYEILQVLSKDHT